MFMFVGKLLTLHTNNQFLIVLKALGNSSRVKNQRLTVEYGKLWFAASKNEVCQLVFAYKLKS